MSDNVFYIYQLEYVDVAGRQNGRQNQLQENAQKSLIRGGAFLARGPTRAPPSPLFSRPSGAKTKSVHILITY
jgi:hypothetical protein